MPSPTVKDALQEILDLLTKEEDREEKSKKAIKTLGRWRRNKELKAPLAPLAPHIKSRPEVGRILQFCLELAPEHPLHQAADQYLRDGHWTKPVLVSLCREPQPECF